MDFQYDEIISIEEVGEDECYDLTLLEDDVYLDEPNFIANDIVVHNCGMADRFIKRKKGEEPYSIHPVMEPFLKKTYGVMVYQEQVMDILRVVGGIPDMHTEKVRKAISKKKVQQFIKYKQMFLENGQKTLKVNLDFVQQLWEQIESFAEYGFNLSHACAYTYISSRLLWLKAHYPLEFYTAILMCENDDDKFKDYRLDAKNHNINICPVHINKSKDNFHIEDNEIYFGFSKVKDIGVSAAQRIMEGQPYKDFEDFLNKFGTDTTPIKALIAIGVFDHFGYSRLKLRQFHEYYKDKNSKRKARQQRYEESIIKKQDELTALLRTEVTATDPDFSIMNKFDDQAAQKWQERFATVMRTVTTRNKTKEVSLADMLMGMFSRWKTSIETFAAKESASDENPLSISQFGSDKIKLDEEEIGLLTEEIEVDGMKGHPSAERKYYGFQWLHQLETCPNYDGLTIDKFLQEAEMNPNPGCIEIIIRSTRKTTTKNGVDYWKVVVEDANGKQMTVHVWKDDYIRWQDELKKNTMMKIRVRPPGGGFNTLTFESVPKRERHKLGPKEMDCRIVVMTPPQPVEKKPVDLTDFVFDPSQVKGL
jgi:DNA polymerase III alpha subunit